jgi:3-oxoacyl-[acyl-carrier protein] reductase
MDLGLKNKSVLVMASSGGIGRGVALELAREGANVMLFSRSADKLQAVADEIAAIAGAGEAAVFPGDVTKAEDIEAAVEKTVERFGGLWGLFNNTGGPAAGPFDDHDDEAWQGAYELTLLSYVRAIRAALPHLRASGDGGRIVNNTSASTKQAIDGLILSNVFRAGLVGLGKSLARELGSDGILVNTVGPGRIDTERVEQLDNIWAGNKGISYEEQRKQSEASIPTGAYGEPAEFGRVVAFMMSTANTYLTGQNILIDGGMVASY